MQERQFRKLREGDRFIFTNSEGAQSQWLVTGADGGELIDAKCIDPLPYDTAEEVFYLSQASHITLASKWVVTNGFKWVGIFRFQSDAEHCLANLKTPGFWIQIGSR